jgi:hypothetical protein
MPVAMRIICMKDNPTLDKWLEKLPSDSESVAKFHTVMRKSKS